MFDSHTNLMAGVSDHTAFFWERLERMARNKPSSLDVVALEHLKQTADTNRPGEEAFLLISVHSEADKTVDQTYRVKYR